MQCRNCLGEIDGNSVTCPMCGEVLDIDEFNPNVHYSEVRSNSFKNKSFWFKVIKIVYLLGIIILVCSGVYIYAKEMSVDFKQMLPSIIMLIVLVVCLVLIITKKKKW